MADSKFKISIQTLLDNKGVAGAIAGLHAVGNAARSAGQWVGRMFSRALIGTIGAATAGVWQLVGALKAFATQEMSEAALVSALKQMGVYTESYSAKLHALASELQETTKVGDDVWLKQFAQLTRFGMHAGNVDKVSDALKNLAGLMDGNVESAATALQRAMEGEFSMFSRYGIKLDLTGDKVRDLNNLFELLATKGAGSMEARAGTLQGAWDGLRNAFGDFKEEVGRTFERVTNLRGGLARIEAQFKALQESAKSGGIAAFIEGGVEKAGELLEQLKGIANYVKTEGAQGVKELASASKDIVIGLFKMGAEAAAKLLAAAVPALGKLLGSAALNAFKGKDEAQAKAEGSARFEAQRLARQQAEEELGPEDKTKGLLFSKKNREIKARREELESQYYRQLLPAKVSSEREKEQQAASDMVGGGRGEARFQSGLNKYGQMATIGNAEAAMAEQRRQQEIADRTRRAAEFKQRSETAFETAKTGYGNLQGRIAVGQQNVVNQALHGTKEGLESAQASLQADKALANQIHSLASRLNSDMNGGPSALSLQLLEKIIAEQNSQAAKLKQLDSQIRTNRLLPAKVSSEREKEQQAASDMVGGGRGEARFQSGLNKYGQMATIGNAEAAMAEQRRQQEIADRTRRAAEFKQRSDSALDSAKTGYGNLQGRIAVGKQSVVQEALHGTKESLDSAQASLQADKALADQIYSLASRIKTGGEAGPAALSLQVLEKIIAEQNSQAAKLKQLDSQIRTNRS